MRHTVRISLLLLLVLLSSLLAAGCIGGPDDADSALTAACERQREEVEEEEEGTETAKSTEDRLEDEQLVECAGQAPVSAAEGEGEGSEDGSAQEGSDSEGSDDEAGEDAGGEEAEGAGEGETGGTTTVALDPAARELFADKCGICHTLSDAETDGGVGPNLDETDMDEGEIAKQIEEGGDGMPPMLLEGEDVKTVAAYVAAARDA